MTESSVPGDDVDSSARSGCADITDMGVRGGMGIGWGAASGGCVSVLPRTSELAEARSTSVERRMETVSSALVEQEEEELDETRAPRPGAAPAAAAAVALEVSRRRPLMQRCESSSAWWARPVAMYNSCNLENVRLKSWLSRPRNASRISRARFRLCSALSNWPCSAYSRPRL